MQPGTVRIGYKASAEQFGPRELLALAQEAERRGLDLVAVSDHFQPWRHSDGHAPAALTWLGALGATTSRVAIGTSVLTPTLRYAPAVVAQQVATLAALNPGRVFLGVGTGEALNERPATGRPFPPAGERRRRLEEALVLIRRLWTEERVDFAGEFYATAGATVYDRPDPPVPVLVAAAGPLAAELAGLEGDGLICTSGKDPALYRTLLDGYRRGRDAAAGPEGRRMIEVKVSYDRDPARARGDCRPWAALAIPPEERSAVGDALEMERLADRYADRAHTRFIVSDDPAEVVERIGGYLDLGFDDLVLHAPGPDQGRFLEQFTADVLPGLRSRADRAAAGAEPSQAGSSSSPPRSATSSA